MGGIAGFKGYRIMHRVYNSDLLGVSTNSSGYTIMSLYRYE